MDYAIGDIQGCYTELMHLLERLHFDEKKDTLWCSGDLVNRGPDSLAVLRFFSSLPNPPIVTLGNHDLHFLAAHYHPDKFVNQKDTFNDILKAPDREELVHWLKSQRLCYMQEIMNVFMAHAGLCPYWSITDALLHSKEIEHILQSDKVSDFFLSMYGNEPSKWRDDLQGDGRYRLIINYFTRMRFLDKKGHLVMNKDCKVEEAPELIPWFDYKRQLKLSVDILFGHWAALHGETNKKYIYALDKGCVYGGKLRALCLQTRELTEVNGYPKGHLDM